MPVIGKTAQLEGQVDSSRVGYVNAGQSETLGDGLSSHVLLEGDGEIGSRRITIFVGENHTIFSVDDAHTCHKASTGNMSPLLRLVNIAAVELDFPDVVSCVDSEFVKLRARVDEHIY